MIAGALCFSVMINLVRHLTESQHTFEIVFFRNFFGLLAMLPWLLRRGAGALRTRRWGLHLLRAMLGLLAMSMWFWTLSVLPLAEATALSFTAPMWAALLAILFLGEPPYRHRWLAMAGAFAGALVILRPGIAALHPGAVVALATAFVWGASTAVVKALGRTEPSPVIVTLMVLLLTPLSLLAAVPVWKTPDGGELVAFLALGCVGSAGHYCLSRAVALADAGSVAPFDYLRLPFAATLAWLLYGERVDGWTWAGAAVIVASGLLAARIEARRNRPRGIRFPLAGRRGGS